MKNPFKSIKQRYQKLDVLNKEGIEIITNLGFLGTVVLSGLILLEPIDYYQYLKEYERTKIQYADTNIDGRISNEEIILFESDFAKSNNLILTPDYLNSQASQIPPYNNPGHKLLRTTYHKDTGKQVYVTEMLDMFQKYPEFLEQ